MITKNRSTLEKTGWTCHLKDVLAHQAKQRPDKEAVVFGSLRLTYRMLEARSLAIQEQLAGLGISRGDKVAVLYSNQPDFIAIFFAVLGLGAVVVPCNPMLRSGEIAHILSDSGARTIIVEEKLEHEVLLAAPNAEALEYILVGASAGLEKTTVNGVRRLELVQASLPSAKERASVEIDAANDLALLVYTSGTTGKPKGAMLTHEALMSVFPFNIFSPLDLNESEKIIGVLPMCHIYGIGVLVCTPVALGATVVMLPKFDAEAALSVVENERVTMIPAVPAMYQFMIMEMDKRSFDVSSVRFCLSAAAPISPELLTRISERFQAGIVEGYGMSETAGGGTLSPPGSGKVGSVGKSIKQLSIAILDVDGTMLPPGSEHVGEIAIKGPSVMSGYHNQPEASAEAMENGWLKTGDLGYSDADGYLYIVGRKKELIIRGGQNIYPREIEEALLKMDRVADAAVIGIPDDYMGERVKAFVVVENGASLTEDEIKAFLSEHLAAYKVPRIFEFVSEIPRNSTGKILKRLLK